MTACKESLQRVLDGSRSDARLLQQRLGRLMAAWETDPPDEDVDAVPSAPAGAAGGGVLAAPAAAANAASTAAAMVDVAGPPPATSGAALAAGQQPRDDTTAAARAAAERGAGHPRMVVALQRTVSASLPAGNARAAELADALSLLARQVHSDGATPALAEAVAEVCGRAQRWLGLRRELVDELLALCNALTHGLIDRAEDGGGARVQGERLRLRLADGSSGASARAVRAARNLRDDARASRRAL